MTHSLLKCHIQKLNPQFCYFKVIVPEPIIAEIYQEVSTAQKEKVETHGFTKSQTPLGYIEKHYKNNLNEHIKEFTFKYFVINYLYEQLHSKKIVTCGEPRLKEVETLPEGSTEFTFEISLASQIDFREWKNFPFKAPKRKNYKDIDRQVDSFIKKEQELYKENSSEDIAIGDWVCFNIGLCDANQNPLLKEHSENAWIKIGSEEADTPFQKVFLNKKKNDAFCTNEGCFQEYFSNQLNSNYMFSIHIEDIVHDNYFSFDDFKQQFRLKTNKDIHSKLIEIFSFRNDLSQRRSTVEEALKLLITKHQIDTPSYLILRQQKMVMDAVQSNPDYQVYKTQPNFKDMILQLAIKQVKEMLLIDQLSFDENIKINNIDIKNYLNLLKRQRTKEFIYFGPPPTKIEGQEMPIPGALLKRCCLREKTLNHVIHHLTRK